MVNTVYTVTVVIPTSRELSQSRELSPVQSHTEENVHQANTPQGVLPRVR